MIILTLGLHGMGFGQILSGQVYMLTEPYIEDKCEVIAQCDCCATDLFILPDNEFGMVTRCLFNDNYYKGKYSIKDNKLILNFKQRIVKEIIDEETNKERNESKNVKIESITFSITYCDNKVSLQHAIKKDLKNGSRYTLAKENDMLKELSSTKAWKLISE